MLMQPPDPARATDAGLERPHARLREIPYNYTSFSDREIVIRLLGDEAWQALLELRAERAHRALGAHALRGAGRHLGGVAQPLSAGRPARQPEAARRADRGHAPPPGRDRQAPRRYAAEPRADDPAARAQAEARARRSRSCSSARARRWTRFAAEFGETAALRRAVTRRLARSTRRDNIQFDGLARVSHVTDATDWRVEYPFVVIHPDTEDEVAADRARLHRARTHDHSARRRHRLHRRRDAARLASRR